MENCADSEQFVLRSSIQTGFKREFEFAMKAQSEICWSLGRTRASKHGNVVQVVNRRVKKRSKKSSSTKVNKSESKSRVVESVDGGGRADVMSEKEAKSDVDVEELKNLHGQSIGKVGALDDGKEPKNDGNVVVDEKGKVGCEGEAKEGGEVCFSKEDGVVGGPTPISVIADSGDSVKGSFVSVEKPFRRFTKSLLKIKLEDDATGAKGGFDKGNDDAEAVEVGGNNKKHANDRGKDVEEKIKDGALVTMSKASTKRCPTSLKELLATRILEGLPARKAGGTRLPGVISGDGIVCHCEHCHGVEVVKPALFELHASSSNKCPPEYIYLENGSTLQDMMNTCLNIPLETLEEAVQKVIGGFTIKKSTFCFNCRDAHVVSRLLCNVCMELKKCFPNPSTQTNDPGNCNVSLAVQSRYPEPIVVQKSINNGMKHSTSRDSSEGKITRKDLHMHKLIFEADVLPDGTKVAYYVRGKRLLDGYKHGFGIVCSCCDKEISPSQFEAHAGWASRRKPYLHIYTSNGVSLHELSINYLKERKSSSGDSDDLCSMCFHGGDLFCCNGCPRAFHIDCVPLSSIPTGTWYCKYCHNVFQKDKYVERNANALAAGRIAGVDPLAEIQERCIRIVKTHQVHHEGCVLCRKQYFSKIFSLQTMMICDQCEKEYHVGCMKDHNIQNLEALPEGNWFCCSECNEVHTALGNLVVGEEENLPDSLLSLIEKKHAEKGLGIEAGLDIKCKVLNWNCIASDNTRKLLSKAVAILHERFGPINSDSRADFIPAMIYGRKIGHYDFCGTYCAILTVNQVIASVGIFRVFGHEVAELPLVATPIDCQGQGYFQCLFSCIERLLASLKVKHLVLPAAEEAEPMWINKFGFTRVDQDEINDYWRRLRLMMFQDTPLLRKPVPTLSST
ncbi:hypothetical protein PIB30_013170 [Stylosanthes scabra]|uniref:PHD-type domain-containing protein n=1 Tax=Stylosanthes scabra TaxID=79078 RepID=A0ABU6Y5W2_9FABA|nr:hypothetical protein [Stylosanthes scabra]